MPYKKDQARAIFLDIQRKKGQEAAKAFGRKHRDDLKGAKSAGRPYTARRRRSS